jgi:tetratricopeptide (TPR) repeat protein
VRAALAIQRALVEINARNASKGAPELSARIGLDSGQVVVDATGEVFGDAPNIAARVQGAAEPGSILITATVQRQTAGLFVAEDRGQHALKGMSAPMTLYRVVRASGGGRRGGARALTPLVGREEELDLLARRWERARKGEGQLALIVGEPGLGKSRLMEEFHGRLGETPHTWTEWSSSQLLQNTPLHPIGEWGRQRFGADLSTEQRLADLENTLGLIGLDATEYAPLLAPLVDVLLPEDRVAKLAPEELRRRQLAAMTAWILAAARTQAIVLAFEDLHWADPTSLDLMRALAERGAQAPLLIIATARPEFRPPWSVRSHHSVISLSPLDSVQIVKMVRELSAHHALPRDIVEGVSERTGGVPLFVEEVTRLLLERGEHGGAQAIPPTLQQSLAARLDRLGAARETAQIGAVLGRGFSYALLQSVAGLDEGALRSSLERLAEADILFVEGDGAQATYRFKHALIQDAAYDSLLKSRRQALHAQAAETLSESASPEPEAIAHHFTEAGLDNLAIEWWGKAGDQALRRSAFQEAIAHLGKAIAMAAKGGREDSRTPATVPAGQKMKLHADLSQATMLAKGYTAKDTKEAFARLEEAARQTGETKPSFADFYARWVVDLMQGRHAKAKQTAQAFLRAAQSGGGTTEIAAAHRALGWSCFALGELQSALSEYQSGLDLLCETTDDDSRFQFAMDTRGSTYGYRSCACWIAGDAESWRAGNAAALDRAEALGHVPTSVNIYWLEASGSTIRRDAEAARSEAARVIDLSQTHGLAQYLAYGEICIGWALANLGSSATGLAMVRRALNDQNKQDSSYWRPWFMGLLADLELTAGNPEAALQSCDDALGLAKETGEAWSDAALLRLRGDILFRLDPYNHTAVQTTYDEAIRIARTQGARTFELAAALALAKLYQSPAPSKPTPSSRPRSKPSHKRRKCRRSRRRRRC